MPFRNLKTAALALVFAPLAALCAATATANPIDPAPDLVYVGSQGNQIHALRFDARTGKLTVIGAVAETPKPSWVVAHPRLPMLYAVDEEGLKEGRVVAFAVDRETGALTRVNEVAAGGRGTAYLGLDASSDTLLAANYGDGSVSSIAVNPDGSLGALVSTVGASGSGPSRRQAGPHAHAAVLDPSGRHALVPDLGADRVFVLGFDPATHALSPEDAAHPPSFVAPAGSGPRHIAFGADGRFAYLLGELTADLMTLRWNARDASLALVQSLPTTRPDFQGVKSGSEVAVSRDGRFVYAANRGENTLVVYRVDLASGRLSFVQRLASGGETPWSFAADPSGRWLLVANAHSDNVRVFRVEPASGMLSDTGQSVDSPAPVSIAFMH